MTRPTGPLDAMRAAAARLTGMFRTSGVASMLRAVDQAIRPLTETMRRVAQQRTAAEETAKALAELPKPRQRALTVIMMFCPGNEMLLRVVRIPDSMPAAAYGRHLVIPGLGVTFRSPDGRVPAKAWYLTEEISFDVQCRCHPRPVTLTPEQVRGVSRPPRGIGRTGGVLES